MQRPASVLVVEDENIIALDIKATLTNLGYAVPAVATGGEEAVQRVAELAPDLVLMDIRLRGGMDGVEAAEAIHNRFDVPVVYLTAYADPGTVERARLTEPYGYVLKPFEERELHVVIEMALYRHQMARKLKESERWLSVTLRSIGDAVIAVDGEWRVCFMNPVAEHLTGWQVTSAIGRELAEVLRVSITTPPRPLPSDEHLSGGGVAEGVLFTPDGREVPIEESSTTIRNEEGRVVGSVIALRDITDRKRHTEAPPAADPAGHSDARAASRRLLAAGERELQRIVLDMHDGPVQDIFAAVSQLQLLVPLLADNAPAAKRARQAVGMLERALGEIRDFIGAFRPPGFERRPLMAIIEGLAVQHETLTDQAVELTAAANVGDCVLATKIALYRILQEALSNGYRHSGASRQRVSVTRSGAEITITVSDDGRGFDLEQVLEREVNVGVEGGHFGLRGIQDRVTMLGGRFALESSPGRGTSLTVTLPAE